MAGILFPYKLKIKKKNNNEKLLLFHYGEHASCQVHSVPHPLPMTVFDARLPNLHALA